MDYNTSTISRIDITGNEENIETILKNKGFNIDECAYMISDEEIDNINIIN